MNTKQWEQKIEQALQRSRKANITDEGRYQLETEIEEIEGKYARQHYEQRNRE